MRNRSSQWLSFKPIFTVFVIALLSYLGYYGSRKLENQSIHQPLATISGTIYFLTIFFGPLYIYIATYLQGVSFKRRLIATGLIPFLWMTKDVVLLLESHPLIECLYWYFNPLTIWMVCLLAIEMGIGTLLGRFILKKLGQPIQIFSTAPIMAILMGAILFGGIYAWGQGENLFSIYLDGYRFFFGSGI